MKASAYHLNTTRETPADAEIASHQLMIRSGMIRKLTAGIYSWTPLGLRVLKKVEAIVREEMDRAGYLEMVMPAVQPAELWRESKRWEEFGGQLLKITDRGGREYCFGPTHEEVITDFVRNEIRSYKQLPITFYQIQTKFRDEIRPRFGVMRAREFLMKDAYSFHLDAASLEETFWEMHGVYSRIFERSGLRFRPVEADSGSIGGNRSIEFHVLADSGEDVIAFSDASDYAANLELCPLPAPAGPRPEPGEPLRKEPTPDVRSIDDLVSKHGVPVERTIKTLIVQGEDGLVALLLRGDHELNPAKAAKLPQLSRPLTFAEEKDIRAAVGAGPGSIGPVGLDLPVVADHAVAVLADFVTGANEDGQHLFGVNFGRDLPLPVTADLRNAQAGDPSPDGEGTLDLARGIEVGHIFQLGTKYSEAMNAVVLGEDGRSHYMPMGCYGIGVSRIVAAAIEQNHDERGIVWPAPLAPFELALLPMNAKKSPRVQEATDALYGAFVEAGVEVLLDDRNLRPGVMFNDMELIGVPHRLVIGERGLDAGVLEYRARSAEENEELPADDAVRAVLEKLGRS